MLKKITRFFLIQFLALNSCLGFSQEQAPIDPEAESELSNKVEAQLEKVSKQEESNIYKHRDLYFLGGHPNSKVQISFKLKPILNFDLFLAYTQVMFWRITADSSPFTDINFQPELFYDWTFHDQVLQGIRAGLEHRSNGKDGLDSRSIDRTFVEFNSQLGYGTYRMRWDLRLFWVYDYDWQSDRNIKEYMGFWETRISLDSLLEHYFPAKGEVYLQFHPGGELSTHIGRGAVEAGIKYRIRLFKIMPYLMFQYYYGSMESLLTYDKIVHSYRLGFTL